MRRSRTLTKNDFRSPSGEVLGNAPVPPFDGAPKSGCIIGYSPQTRTEVLTVPEAVLGAAFARGLPYIVLRRTWLNFIKLDGNISVNFPGPDVTIDIIYKPATPSTPPISGTPTTPSTPATSGTIGAELSVSRLFLRFEDGSLVRLLPSGGRLRGVAEIDYAGSGLLTGIWEIAEPPSTQGSPLYRTLEMVTRNLAGTTRVLLTSPRLPAEAVGLHLLRFRITSQGRDVQTLQVIQYYVGTGGAASPVLKPSTPLPVIAATGPGPSAVLTEKSSFSWETAPGSRAYLLEIFDKPNPAPEEGPAGGIIVTGDMTATAIPPVTGMHLQPGRTYWWRVRAIGFAGDFIGESRLREFVAPAKQ